MCFRACMRWVLCVGGGFVCFCMRWVVCMFVWRGSDCVFSCVYILVRVNVCVEEDLLWLDLFRARRKSVF